jgi:hypothetical protein
MPRQNGKLGEDDISFYWALADRGNAGSEGILSDMVVEGILGNTTREGVQREIVRRYVLNGTNQIEIAAMLGISQMAVSRELRKWKERARKEMQKYYGEPEAQDGASGRNGRGYGKAEPAGSTVYRRFLEP